MLVSVIQGALDNGEEATLSPSGTPAIDRAYQAFLVVIDREVLDVDRPPR